MLPSGLYLLLSSTRSSLVPSTHRPWVLDVWPGLMTWRGISVRYAAGSILAGGADGFSGGVGAAASAGTGGDAGPACEGAAAAAPALQPTRSRACCSASSTAS